MEFKLVVEQRKTAEGRYFNTSKVVCINEYGDEVLVTYDKDVICNILGCSPAKLRTLQVGTHNLSGKE